MTMMFATILVLMMGSASADMVNMSILLTRETVLSGSLTSCDPSPNVSTCVGGMASVGALARQQAKDTNGTVFMIPLIDTLSDLALINPFKVGISLLFYLRIRASFTTGGTNVDVLGYRIDPATLANGGSSLTVLLQAALFKPLSSSLGIPPNSVWRYVVQTARVVDLNTMTFDGVENTLGFGATATSAPKVGILQIEESEKTWTTSTRVSPTKTGTRLNATHFTYSPSEQLSDAANTYSTARVIGDLIATLRSRIGFVVVMSSDRSISYTTLLQDMLAAEIYSEFVAAEIAASNGVTPDVTLSHLPDVFYEVNGDAITTPTAVDITATYVATNGQHITKTRQVVVASKLAGGTVAINLNLNRTAIEAGVGKAAGTVLPTSMMGFATTTAMNTTLTDPQKDSLYYDDQTTLLTYSRISAASDRLVGSIAEPLPQLEEGPTVYTCYGGECAQGTLTTRAMKWKFDTDVAFFSSDTPVAGPSFPAGNITLLDTFTIYKSPDLPCKAVITGLRLWQLIDATIALSKFTTAYSATGASLLQIAGVQIEYAIQTTGFGRVVSVQVYNSTTSSYAPLERLTYYTVVTTNYQCLYQPIISDYFRESRLYRGESVESVFSTQPVQEVMAAYLASNSPYTPAFVNYYIEIPLSQLTSGVKTYTSFQTGLSSCSSTQSYDAEVATCFDCESGYERSPFDVTECVEIPPVANNTPLIIGLAVGGGLLLIVIVAVAVLCEYRRRSGSRSNHNAPDGKQNVAVVFTDIKSSTRLWGAAPASMGISLDAHHNLIREAIGEYQGYEVKTVGDSFMIVVDDPQRALDMAVTIQHKLHNFRWPSAIDEAYTSDFTDVLDDPEDVAGPEPGMPWNGIRVRIGIHYGPVEVVFDNVTKGYDYYGSTVNVAARVEGVTDGGQTCASGDLMSAVQATTSTYQSMLLAKTTLRGVREEVELYEIKPVGLSGRTFNNPLIFDEEAKAAMMFDAALNGDISISTNTRTSGVTHTSQTFTPLTATTRPIRDSIREAFKALRGSERVGMLEKLRKAWRVDLPSGNVFTGLSAEQMVKKQRRQMNKKGGRTQHRSQRPTSQHSGVSSISPRKLTLISVSGASMSMTTGDSTVGSKTGLERDTESVVSHTDEEEEDEEDIIFRQVAQRIAPALKNSRTSTSKPKLSIKSESHLNSAAASGVGEFTRSASEGDDRNSRSSSKSSRSGGDRPRYSPASSYVCIGDPSIVGSVSANSNVINILMMDMHSQGATSQ